MPFSILNITFLAEGPNFENNQNNKLVFYFLFYSVLTFPLPILRMRVSFFRKNIII